MRELHWNPAATDANQVLLVPGRTLLDTIKSLGTTGSIDLAFGGAAGGDGLVGFEAGQRRSTTVARRRKYPKVSSIFPTSSETEVVLATADLVEAVKRVALVAERNTPVRLKFGEGHVTIEAGTGDDAQASEAVEATLTGPDLEIAFNPTSSSMGWEPWARHTPGSPSPSRAGPPSCPARTRPTGTPTRPTATC